MSEPVTRDRVSSRILKGLLLAFVLGACDSSNGGIGPGSPPAAPVGLDAFYFNRAVHLSWELGPGWSGEAFRVYGKRVTDANYVLVAEVTNCAGGACSYRDINIVANNTYEYFVAAVGAGGAETASDVAIEVHVPTPTPPPVPGGIDAVALDGAIFLTWNATSRTADDFAFYRVYFFDGTAGILIGETDSEGFLDLLVENGATYSYFVTAVDDRGHESQGSPLAQGTPRPDFHGEFLFAFQDVPEDSGFRFEEDEETLPVVHGTDPSRHFRLEADGDGWWLVPRPGVQVHSEPEFTTALRCGPVADSGCIDVRQAPSTGYTGNDVLLVPEFSYVIRVPSQVGGVWRYGLVRVTHVGLIAQGAIAIFDWAFQLQPDNLDLAPPAP